MTNEQEKLVNKLRHELLRFGYPKVFIVDNDTLEAVELYLLDELNLFYITLRKQKKDPILKCGRNGLWFKNCELVLEVRR